MQAILVSAENLDQLRQQFNFEEYPYTVDDPEKGKHVERVEYETDDIVGKWLVVDDELEVWSRGFGVLSPEVFEAGFNKTGDFFIKNGVKFSVVKRSGTAFEGVR